MNPFSYLNTFTVALGFCACKKTVMENMEESLSQHDPNNKGKLKISR